MKENVKLIIALILLTAMSVFAYILPDTEETIGQAVTEPVIDALPVKETPKEQPPIKEPTIREKLTGKTKEQSQEIKVAEILKANIVKDYTDKKEVGIRVEIVGDITPIKAGDQSGVEVFARAWKDGEQLGFGEDGTVEIERFKIFNPPVLVDDPLGDIVVESTYYDVKTKQDVVKQRFLKEDPAEALMQSLAHTISVVGKDGKDIIPGKVGNTTSTYNPSAGASSPVDGFIDNNAVAAYATVQGATAGVSLDQLIAGAPCTTNYKDGTRFYVRRGFFGFNINDLGADTVTSATFSIAGDGNVPENANSDNVSIVSATPASNSTLALGDFDQVGTTVYGSKLVSSWVATSGTYNDFTLDANGIADLDDGGVQFLATRNGRDISITAPTGGNALNCLYADNTGTSADPKLVLVHSAPAAGGGASGTIIFE